MRMPAVLSAAAVTGWCAPALAPVVSPIADALGIARRYDGASAAALTFDDGPHPEGTPAVLEVLARHGATATFFLVGEQVERHRALAAEIAAAGHEIAVHGHRHRNALRLTPGAFSEDLERGADAIAGATGAAPERYRPPYGIFSAGALAVARRRFEPLLWSRWGRDWAARSTPASITAGVTRDVRGGDVLLLHDADYYSTPGSWRDSAAALPGVLEALAERGVRACSARECAAQAARRQST